MKKDPRERVFQPSQGRWPGAAQLMCRPPFTENSAPVE